MTYNTLRYEVAENILTLTLNRPEQLNSFTVEMANELIAAFNRASADDEVRAIVVTGEGRAFCAGMDLTAAGNVFGLDESLQPTLEDMTNRLEDPQMIASVRDTGGRVTLAIYDCNKPVIAAINGAAVGIGATMTCAMDIRLASEHARIGFVFNKIGITPEACSTWFLPRIVGMSRALEWCYTGDILAADEALASGYVKAVVPADKLLEEAYKIAAKIARHSPVAIALTRQMMYRNAAREHPLEAHKVDSLAIFYCSQKSGKEGVASFLEKRAPQFTDTVSADMPPFYPWWE
ncbi:MAG: crotonase/enoyl-CoA hydratase family protein [Halieaceae bacterium]|nr:crotonase/enoyl-CoA hydratase family protein [Halieaceae bacterium]MCP5146977.1 crotonase/enoyl-CoA hydratase family protein [Pseudomonadales bacterium]MCP5165788.1 crotonase/enoyl-CoA hydratase family protein [Pseudomonadales bacterium]MCP5188676.1 crotonase/enoyl-CoA hydratase family protein [Pseudomonadales bacterium]